MRRGQGRTGHWQTFAWRSSLYGRGKGSVRPENPSTGGCAFHQDRASVWGVAAFLHGANADGHSLRAQHSGATHWSAERIRFTLVLTVNRPGFRGGSIPCDCGAVPGGGIARSRLTAIPRPSLRARARHPLARPLSHTTASQIKWAAGWQPISFGRGLRESTLQ